MKKFLILAASLVAFATTASAQDAALGVWQTEVDDGAYAHITIAPCGAAVCGVISRTFNADGEYCAFRSIRPLIPITCAHLFRCIRPPVT